MKTATVKIKAPKGAPYLPPDVADTINILMRLRNGCGKVKIHVDEGLYDVEYWEEDGKHEVHQTPA